MSSTSSSSSTITITPLNRLLSLASSLHQTKNDHTTTTGQPTTTTLTLRQLVSVHESLCQAVVVLSSSSSSVTMTNPPVPSSSSSSSSLKDLIHQLLTNSPHNNDPQPPPQDKDDDDDPQLAHDILGLNSHDTPPPLLFEEPQVLLVLQYLLHCQKHQSTQNHNWTFYQGLATIVLPFLLRHVPPNNYHSSKELREALLDSVFSLDNRDSDSDNDNDDITDNHYYMDQIAQQCRNASVHNSSENHQTTTTTKTTTTHVTTCRVLVRLYQHVSRKSSIRIQIQQWMHDKVYKCVSTLLPPDTTKTNTKTSKQQISTFDNILLGPLITDMLPLLYPPPSHHYNNHIMDPTSTNMAVTTTSSPPPNNTSPLWILVMTLVKTHLPTNNNHKNDDEQEDPTTLRLLLSLTSLLCTILPALVDQKLPVLLVEEEENEVRPPQLPLHQTLLWDLIQYCTSRGEHETALQTGARGQQQSSQTSASSSTSCDSLSRQAQHELLRRRGLYLLNVLVQEPPEEEQQQTFHKNKKKKNQKKNPKKQSKQPPTSNPNNSQEITTTSTTTPPTTTLQDWRKYCMCFEALEMENESHLIDQVWDSVAELCHVAAICRNTTTTNSRSVVAAATEDVSSSPPTLPPMTWKWLSSMFSRVLLSESPTLRKLGVYRFLNGHVGIDVWGEEKDFKGNHNKSHPTHSSSPEEMDTTESSVEQKDNDNTETSSSKKTKKPSSKAFKKQPNKKHSVKNQKNQKNKKNEKPRVPKAPLELVSTEFVLGILLPSYDSLYVSIGLTMQYEQDGKIQIDHLEPRMATFLGNYTKSLLWLLSSQEEEEEEGHDKVQHSYPKLQSFLYGLLEEKTVCQLRTKTLLEVYRAITHVLPEQQQQQEQEATEDGQPSSLMQLPMTNELLELVVQSFQSLFAKGSVVQSFRRGLLQTLAILLSHSSMTTKVDPKTLLKVLALYPLSTFADLHRPSTQEQKQESPQIVGSSAGSSSTPKKEMEESILESLQQWCLTLGGGGNNDSPSWASTVGAACASAYVAGQLVPSLAHWDPTTGISDTERSMGCAVALLCTLSSSSSTTTTASGLLWPAIHKGMSYAPGALLSSSTSSSSSSSWIKADHVTRGLVLLESGCRLGVLSGLGNGELVIDQKQQMMPPPPTIEGLLQKAVDFILQHIKALTTWEAVTTNNAVERRGGATRSDTTQRVSSKFASLISQMETLHEAYPSSMATSTAVDSMLKLSMESITSETADSLEVVKYTALAYASLSVGANPLETMSVAALLTACRQLLTLEFRGDAAISKSDRQAARSILQYAKWGTLSKLLPVLLLEKQSSGTSSPSSPQDDFCSDLFEVALDSVHATPADALLPLFECVLIAAQHWLPQENNDDTNNESKVADDDSKAFTDHLEKIISALFTLMKDTPSSRTSMYMLNEICSLIFRPRLLLDEAERLEDECEAPAPIRDAFHKLIEMAGTQRNHISTCVVSWISVGWLGLDSTSTTSKNTSCGIGAIPYAKVIANLLLHKEAKLDESSVHQDPMSAATSGGKIVLPPEINALSIVRGFLLLFISKLPDSTNGLDPKVLSKLLHPIIFSLLDDTCLAKTKGSMLTTGSLAYCQKMRAWQSLCVLSRFVTNDVAESVCRKIFSCLDQTLHGQIRYFVEVFTIQCSRLHPEVFGKMFVQEIRRTDLTLQHVSSLMIIGGNLIVGRYQVDFLRQFEGENANAARLHEVLAGTLPWLSSTQGFSRAIAQIIVHKIIPLVVDVTSKDSKEEGESDWFLKSMYMFLDKNPEMKRLRDKQSKIFETYDVDTMCTPEGILNTPVDEGDEANPLHVVESMKRCLEQVYEEAHEKDAPQWKNVKEMLDAEGSEIIPSDSDENEEESSLVNFQRKIIPLDSLNLAMEETRQQSLRNATGRKKQDLIVCASLIDKVPNVAGLARTAEIFAADRLIVPDKKQTKMDNFKSISVSAGEWIQIDECNEKNLLSWLREQKENGYTIVGVEQTSSSISIEKLSFPERTVLLLGKEKEGIPVEFLQAVDVCVEIPQLGIIRSLNVHVSGSVAIWEYTKQMLTAKK